MRNALVRLFTDAAGAMGTFFAAAYVDREVIYQGRSLGYDFRSFHAQRVMIPLWGGLPQLPMWLSWFGPPYVDLVSEAVGSLAVPIDGGLFLQASELPVHTDQFRGRVPELPSRLTQNSRRRVRVVTHADGSRGELYEPVFELAEHIPPLDL